MIGKGHFYLHPNPIATAPLTPPPRARAFGAMTRTKSYNFGP